MVFAGGYCTYSSRPPVMFFFFSAKKIIDWCYDGEGEEENEEVMELDEKLQDGWLSRLRQTNQGENRAHS